MIEISIVVETQEELEAILYVLEDAEESGQLDFPFCVQTDQTGEAT